MNFQWTIRDVYQEQKRQGGRMIERLGPKDLAAAATTTHRTVEQLLEDNGYQRPANVATDEALGG